MAPYIGTRHFRRSMQREYRYDPRRKPPPVGPFTWVVIAIVTIAFFWLCGQVSS